MNPFDYWLIGNIAFFSSISHCMGMCGGIVMALNAKILKNEQNIWLANLLYNFGRLSAYIVIGALCGGFGIVFEITPFIKSSVLLILGVLVILFSILFFFAPKWIAKFEPEIQMNSNGRYKRFFTYFYRCHHPISFYALGILNGFLPCGIVYFFALIALSSGHLLSGMIVMFIFGVMTFLPLLVLSFVSQFFFNLALYRYFFLKLSAAMMFALGVYTFYKGIRVIILPK